MKKRKCSISEESHDVYTVETIYKKKMRNNKEPLYFIKWKDWDDKYNSWEPLSNILDHSLIETFEDEIRQKQKLRKEATKNKKIDWDKLDYESDVKSESHKEVDVSNVENVSDEVITKVDQSSEVKPSVSLGLPYTEEVSRPKICIKIPKYRLHPPNPPVITNSFSSDFNSPEIEIPRHGLTNSDDDHFSIRRLSPIYLAQKDDVEPSLNNEFSQHNLPNKEHFSKKSKKHLSRINQMSKKPRKLLSINEYSAVIKMKKKHHKKSKHSKHRSENKVFQATEEIKTHKTSEKNISSKWHIKRIPEEKPLFVEKKTEKLIKVRLKDINLKSIKSKVEVNKLRFHSQTIVTDVTVNGLCVTVKEMSYEDFMNDSCQRQQLIRLPKNSDWIERYLGECDEKHEMKSSDTSDNEDESIILESNETEEVTKKQQMLDKFEERIIPGLRPPSRSRSVDSYKNIIDKTMYGININHLNESMTPNKIMTENLVFGKSPLNIVVDESEEVDVVGGIDSENSFMSSLQSTRTTVTTQLRQSRLSTQSPVSSIIQSLWHSYSYHSPAAMPPLQAAPWVQNNDIAPIHLPQQSYHPYLSRPNSIDPNILKYSQSIPLSYYQQSSNLSNFYLPQGEERPIDLSFK